MSDTFVTSNVPSRQIGLLNEKSLHAQLKEWYGRPGDRREMAVEDYIIDIVRDDMLIEVQTRNFSAAKRKLLDLTTRHPVRLVYPIASEKWIKKLAQDASALPSRRKSPKRGMVEQVFAELVSFPQLLGRDNFTLEVLLIREEEVRRYDGKRGWRRRGWVTHERHLLEVVARRLFQTPDDVLALIPPGLDEPFTTQDLAGALRQPRRLAQQMAYCLRKMGVIVHVGSKQRSKLYRRT